MKREQGSGVEALLFFMVTVTFEGGLSTDGTDLATGAHLTDTGIRDIIIIIYAVLYIVEIFKSGRR